jgi:hypothetical protein
VTLTATLVIAAMLAQGQVATLPRQQASERHGRILHAVIAANGIASFADISVTMYGVGSGQLLEANPLLRWAEHRPVGMALVKGSIAALTTVALIKAHKSKPKAAMVLAVVLTLMNGYVAVRNAKLLR